MIITGPVLLVTFKYAQMNLEGTCTLQLFSVSIDGIFPAVDICVDVQQPFQCAWDFHTCLRKFKNGTGPRISPAGSLSQESHQA